MNDAVTVYEFHYVLRKLDLPSPGDYPSGSMSLWIDWMKECRDLRFAKYGHD